MKIKILDLVARMLGMSVRHDGVLLGVKASSTIEAPDRKQASSAIGSPTQE